MKCYLQHVSADRGDKAVLSQHITYLCVS